MLKQRGSLQLVVGAGIYQLFPLTFMFKILKKKKENLGSVLLQEQ